MGCTVLYEYVRVHTRTYMHNSNTLLIWHWKGTNGFAVNRKDFNDLPNAAVELLLKQYKRKPKRTLKSDVALAQQEFSVNNPYFERPATARVSDAVHKWLDTALAELDAPTNMPEHTAIDARVWKRYCNIPQSELFFSTAPIFTVPVRTNVQNSLCDARREKQFSELALKQEVTAISHLKAFLQGRNEEDERTRLEIGEIERAIEKWVYYFSKISQLLARDLQLLRVFRWMLADCTTTGTASCTIWRSSWTWNRDRWRWTRQRSCLNSAIAFSSTVKSSRSWTRRFRCRDLLWPTQLIDSIDSTFTYNRYYSIKYLQYEYLDCRNSAPLRSRVWRRGRTSSAALFSSNGALQQWCTH